MWYTSVIAQNKPGSHYAVAEDNFQFLASLFRTFIETTFSLGILAPRGIFFVVLFLIFSSRSVYSMMGLSQEMRKDISLFLAFLRGKKNVIKRLLSRR